MKIFNDETEARASLHEKKKVYLNGLCPYTHTGRLCGSWCSLFYYIAGDENESGHIILGCKSGTDKKLYL